MKEPITSSFYIDKGKSWAEALELSKKAYTQHDQPLQKMTSESPRFESWDERRRCSVIPSWDCLEQQFFIFNCFGMTIKLIQLIIWNKNIEERKQLYL